METAGRRCGCCPAAPTGGGIEGGCFQSTRRPPPNAVVVVVVVVARALQDAGVAIAQPWHFQKRDWRKAKPMAAVKRAGQGIVKSVGDARAWNIITGPDFPVLPATSRDGLTRPAPRGAGILCHGIAG